MPPLLSGQAESKTHQRSGTFPDGCSSESTDFERREACETELDDVEYPWPLLADPRGVRTAQRAAARLGTWDRKVALASKTALSCVAPPRYGETPWNCRST
jgi:hypothetical protein